MSDDLIKSVQELIESGTGDSKRLHNILNILKQEAPLYFSDYKYLQSLISNLPEKKENIKETNSSKTAGSANEDYNILVIKNRLAKGEITIDEFRALKKALKQE